MLEQSNNSPVMGAGGNERGGNSQYNTSRNQGTTSNENEKHNDHR